MCYKYTSITSSSSIWLRFVKVHCSLQGYKLQILVVVTPMQKDAHHLFAHIMLSTRNSCDTIIYSPCTGGLLCRAMIETVAGHNVHNFVSLSAPMMGQFGRELVYKFITLCLLTVTDYIRTIFPNYTEDHLYL